MISTSFSLVWDNFDNQTVLDSNKWITSLGSSSIFMQEYGIDSMKGTLKTVQPFQAKRGVRFTLNMDFVLGESVDFDVYLNSGLNNRLVSIIVDDNLDPNFYFVDIGYWNIQKIDTNFGTYHIKVKYYSDYAQIIITKSDKSEYQRNITGLSSPFRFSIESKTDTFGTLNAEYDNFELNYCGEGKEYCNGKCIDVVCYSNSDCDDNNPLTTDTCLNAGLCDSSCKHEISGCSSGQVLCDGICVSIKCSLDSDCDDLDSCTIDSCLNDGSCNSLCVNERITSCVNSDSCCPSGCDSLTDSDCPSVCGNDICESNENDKICLEDCRTEEENLSMDLGILFVFIIMGVVVIFFFTGDRIGKKKKQKKKI